MHLTNGSILKEFTDTYNNGHEFLPPKGDVTIHQRALFIVWMALTIFYIFKLLDNGRVSREQDTSETTTTTDQEVKILLKPDETPPKQPPSTVNRPPITLKDAIWSAIIIGCILIYYFFCDYLHYFPKAERTYNRDLFLFLCLLLFCVSISYTLKDSPSHTLLNRDQTEEWKGWMQVMFVWYHYFRAAETYNAVRIYIAAYVWMTGFGNFSFFWVRKDYSLRRVLKMLFRLNFLVILTAFVLDNSYMLYYICAMHTFWFLSVYVMMRPFHEHNQNRKVMALKLVVYFLLVSLLFDVPGVAKTVFQPFSFVLNYQDSLHEWIFRSRLDHYVTFVGMLCAYNHPNAEKLLLILDNHRLRKVIITGLVTILVGCLSIWYKFVFVLPKYDYNHLHPYTSFLPILAFIFLRNMTPWLRSHHIGLFTILGKITLETYISQLHIYLQSNAKHLLIYIVGYPLMSFVVNTVVYLYLSNLLFKGTVVLNEYLFPSDLKKMYKYFLFIAVMFFGAYCLAYGSIVLKA